MFLPHEGSRLGPDLGLTRGTEETVAPLDQHVSGEERPPVSLPMLGEALSWRDWEAVSHTAEEARWPTPAHPARRCWIVALSVCPAAPTRIWSPRPVAASCRIREYRRGEPDLFGVEWEPRSPEGPVELTGGRAVFFCEYFSRHHIEWRDP